MRLFYLSATSLRRNNANVILTFCFVVLMFLLAFSVFVSSLFATHAIAVSHDHQMLTNEVKSVGEYRKDLMTFVKRSKNKSDYTQRYGAVVDLCSLHQQIVSDSRFAINQQLKGFRAIAADRLRKCSREIEVEMKRFNRYTNRIAKAKGTKSRKGSASSKSTNIPQLAKQRESIEQALVQDMQAITQISGGPVNLWAYTGGSFGPNGVCDYGPDLVSLIESTISPSSWQSNGGNGVIHYYRPLRILVVSASSQVHDNLSDLLERLR